MKNPVFENILRPTFDEMMRYLGNEKGTATARSSTLYTAFYTTLLPADGRDRNAKVHRFSVGFTIVSASAIGDTYNLLVIPAGWQHSQTVLTGNGLGASAGTGVTVAVGDSGDDDRYVAISDFDLVNAVSTRAYAGANYRPTSDTIMVAKIGTAAGVVGKIVVGFVDLLPPG
jgi:hypothetical protein